MNASKKKPLRAYSTDTSNSPNPLLSSSSFPQKKPIPPPVSVNITKPGTWESWLSLPLTILTSNQSPSPLCSSGADAVLNPPTLLPAQTVTLSPELPHGSFCSRPLPGPTASPCLIHHQGNCQSDLSKLPLCVCPTPSMASLAQRMEPKPRGPPRSGPSPSPV